MGSKNRELLKYDPDFKKIFEEIASDSHTKVLKSVEVGILPLEIDIILEIDKDSELKYLAPIRQIREKNHAQRFVIEYKGPTDTFSLGNVRKLIAYRQLYLIENDVNEERPTVHVVLSSRYPQKLLKTFHGKTHSEGVYSLFLDNQEIYIISINSLPVHEENFGLLIFATKKEKTTKLVEILFDESMIGEENPKILHNKAFGERFLRYAIRWNYEIVVNVARQRGINMSIVKENLKRGIEDIGIAEMVDEIGLSNVVAAVGISKIIEVMGVSKFVELLTEDQKKELKELLK